MSIGHCKLISLPRINDHRGSLSFVENLNHIPFEIKRVYYMYDIHSQAERGAHGHKNLEQLMLPLGGSFSIMVDDGLHQKTFELSRPNEGLYICPMIWREIKNFSPNVTCLVLASDYYDEKDYFRRYDDFLNEAKRNAK